MSSLLGAVRFPNACVPIIILSSFVSSAVAQNASLPALQRIDRARLASPTASFRHWLATGSRLTRPARGRLLKLTVKMLRIRLQRLIFNIWDLVWTAGL